MASWLQHSWFTDMAGGIFSSHRAPSKKNGQLVLKRPKIPGSFQARIFKTALQERVIDTWSASEQLSDCLMVRDNRVIFQESLSSAFWFQPVWTLHAYGQHVVIILFLVGVGLGDRGSLNFWWTTERYASDFIYIPLGGTRSPMTIILIINCLNLLLEFSEAWRLKLWGKKIKKWGTQRCFCTWEGPRVLLSFNPPFLCYSSVLRGTGDRTKCKEIKFSIERLIIYSAGELGFRETQFQVGWL